jgi:AcrR family transcriptional regulator
MFMFDPTCENLRMATPTGLRRRQPVQERSRRRVERILTAAIELLDEGGSDAVTTRAIAARADVPVATLYQFFPNREAILEEVLLDYLDHRDNEAAHALSTIEASTVADAVQHFFEFHRQQYRAHPELVALYYARRGSGRIPDPRPHRVRLAKLIHTALVERNLLRPGTDELVTMIVIEMGDRIVELAYRKNPDGDPAILQEGQVALARYLESYAVSH